MSVKENMESNQGKRHPHSDGMHPRQATGPAKKPKLPVKLCVYTIMFFKTAYTKVPFLHSLFLIGILILLSLVGGLILKLVEAPLEQNTIKQITDIREQLLNDIYVEMMVPGTKQKHIAEVEGRLQTYEKSYIDALNRGTVISGGKSDPLWTIEGSVYFCVTVYTLLGFGNIVPKSNLGRFLTILYAGISIPLSAIILEDIGTKFLTLMMKISKEFSKLIRKVRGGKNSNTSNNNPSKIGKEHQTSSKGWLKKIICKTRGCPFIQANNANDSPFKCFMSNKGETTLGLPLQCDQSNNKKDISVISFPHVRKRSISEKEDKGQPSTYKTNGRNRQVSLNFFPFQFCPHKQLNVSSGAESLSAPLLPLFERNTGNDEEQKHKGLKRNSSLFSSTTFAFLATPLRNFVVGNHIAKCLQTWRKRLSNDTKNLNKNSNNMSMSELARKKTGSNLLIYEEGQPEPDTTHQNAPPLLMILFNVLYITLGSFVMSHVTTNMNFLDAIWFTFISLATIGFGDIVPSDQVLFVYLFPYIFIGLCLMSSTIQVITNFFNSNVNKAKSLIHDISTISEVKRDMVKAYSKGVRAKKHWQILRNKVHEGIPKSLVLESARYKATIMKREKEYVRRAYRIYFLTNFKEQERQIVQDMTDGCRKKLDEQQELIDALTKELRMHRHRVSSLNMGELRRKSTLIAPETTNDSPSETETPGPAKAEKALTRWQRLRLWGKKGPNKNKPKQPNEPSEPTKSSEPPESAETTEPTESQIPLRPSQPLPRSSPPPPPPPRASLLEPPRSSLPTRPAFVPSDANNRSAACCSRKTKTCMPVQTDPVTETTTETSTDTDTDSDSDESSSEDTTTTTLKPNPRVVYY